MSAPAPSRARSLGSSLLDQVLAETLDPAYAQAAAHRAEQEGSTAGPGTARAGHAGRLAVALVLVVVGVLGTVTYRQAARGADGRESVRQSLVADITRESAVSEGLVVALEELRGQVAAARDEALAASSVGQRALDDLERAEQAAAAVPVAGPGIVVTLADAPVDTGSDPVGGTTTADLVGLVQDGDIQLAVNALWAAGAEAISINGARLGPATAIRLAGEAVLVDFRPVTSPYVISAIGDQGEVQEGFLQSPEAAELANVALVYGVVFEIGRDDDLDLPAGRAAELQFARPLPDGAGPSGSPPSDSTTRPGG